MKEFQLQTQYEGYQAIKDVTKVSSSFLVPGSQNVIIDDQEKIRPRSGYELWADKADSGTIDTSYEWEMPFSGEIAFRTVNSKIQYLLAGESSWRDLVTGLSSTDVDFTTWWDADEDKELLLFVNGTSDISMWSGANTTFDSATSNSITKEGTKTWGEEGFLINTSTKEVVINGTTYTYTGGEGTTTLTGVSPDPTTAGHSQGDYIVQSVVKSTSTPASGFQNNIIYTFRNQVWLGDFSKRSIYISSNIDYTNFTPSSPRQPGEGTTLIFDEKPVGFVAQEKSLYVGAQNDFWYAVQAQLSDDLTSETFLVNALLSGEGEGLQARDLITAAKNSVVYISNASSLESLGQIPNIDSPESVPLSDTIRDEFEQYDFTHGHLLFFQDDLYLTLPEEGRVLIYDYTFQLWQPPQILYLNRLGVFEGRIRGHSSSSPESFTLFEGLSDNGNPYRARAVFPYKNYGNRAWQKNFSEWFTEGYMTSNTNLDLTLYYDFSGVGAQRTFRIRGNEDTIGAQDINIKDASLGKEPYGKLPLGSSTGASSSASRVQRFRIIHTSPKQDFYELADIYESYDVDQYWELLAHGGSVANSKSDNTAIKKGNVV